MDTDEGLGIGADDLVWMRRDLLSSLLGVAWFGHGGRSGDGADDLLHDAMATVVVRAMGWTEDRTDVAADVLDTVLRVVDPSATWMRFIDGVLVMATARVGHDPDGRRSPDVIGSAPR